MYKLLKTTLLVNLCIAFYSPLFAQMRPSEEPARPSADAWEQIRYGEVTPTLYTGTVNVSIPLYTYEDPDFHLPLRLVYSSNGCRPNERCGVTGHGWTLDCGGVITREIRGVPDDCDPFYGTRGYHATFQLDTIVDPHYFYLSPEQLRPMRLNYYGPVPFFSGVMFANQGDVNSLYLYDAEPDIYHFSIPGHHGTFHLGPGGKIFVYDTDGNPADYKVEIDMRPSVAAIWDAGNNWEAFRQESCFNGFSITTPDGYIFHFNGYTSASGASSDNDGSNLDLVKNAASFVEASARPYAIVAWHLSRITAPNGRSIHFTYSRNDDLRSIRPACYRIAESGNDLNYHGFPSYIQEFSQTMHYNAVPDAITPDGGCSIRFHYDGTHNESVNGYPDSCILLDSLSVCFGGRQLKNITLGYYESGPYLQDVFISGEGTFSLTYSGTNYPTIGTKAVDHWGFYNGTQVSDFLGVTQVDTSGFQESVIPDNPREPRFSYAQQGLLARITYPTGGWSAFSYEPRDYAKARRRTWSETLFLDEYGLCGGARIRQVDHFDRNGSLLASKSYSYINEDGVTSSGILTYFPRYRVDYSAIMYTTYTLDLPSVYLIAQGNNHMHGFLQSNNLTSYSTTPIEYRRIVETDTEGSKIVYHFSSSERPDLRDWCASSDTVRYDFNVVAYGDDLQAAEHLVMPDITLQSLRGKLTKKDVYAKGAGGEILESESSDYSHDSRYDRVMTRLIHACAETAVFVGRDTLKQQRTTRYNAGNPVIQKETGYVYNAHGQVASQTVEDSDGSQLRTEYTYVTDQARNGTDQAMLEANSIEVPWHERRYRNNVLIAEMVRTFYRPDPTGHPALFCTGSVIVTDPASGAVFTTSYIHDNIGRLVQLTAPDGRSTVQVWGHDGLYPVARIDGATLAQAREAASDPTLGEIPLPGGLDEALAASIRDNLPDHATLSVYRWEPFVGLNAIISPDGRTTTYQYNSNGKLRAVRNTEGDLVTEYLYSPENKSNGQ